MHVSLCTTALCCTRTVSLRRTRTVSLTVLRADKLRGMKKIHSAIISIFIYQDVYNWAAQIGLTGKRVPPRPLAAGGH